MKLFWYTFYKYTKVNQVLKNLNHDYFSIITLIRFSKTYLISVCLYSNIHIIKGTPYFSFSFFSYMGIFHCCFNPDYAIEKPNCTAVIYIQVNLNPHYRGITEIYSISVNVTHKEINYLRIFYFHLNMISYPPVGGGINPTHAS